MSQRRNSRHSIAQNCPTCQAQIHRQLAFPLRISARAWTVVPSADSIAAQFTRARRRPQALREQHPQAPIVPPRILAWARREGQGERQSFRSHPWGQSRGSTASHQLVLRGHDTAIERRFTALLAAHRRPPTAAQTPKPATPQRWAGVLWNAIARGIGSPQSPLVVRGPVGRRTRCQGLAR